MHTYLKIKRSWDESFETLDLLPPRYFSTRATLTVLGKALESYPELME